MIAYKKITLFTIPLLLFLVASILAKVPGDWWGVVRIDDSIAPVGTVVTAHINESSDVVATHIVGTATQTLPGYYLLHVEGAGSDTVTFKVCGIDTRESQSWSEGDHPQLNLSITTTPDGGLCTYDCGCKGGQCVHNACRSTPIYCGDGHCDSGETCSSCEADCGACATGGGGGGGGAATISLSETKMFTTVTPTAPAIITVTKSDTLKIEEIKLEVVNALSNVKITVKEGSRPTTAPVPISSDIGNVYTYVEISKVNIEDGHISVAKIKFKVEKSWISNNNIDETSITLNRLYKNEWARLTTTKLSEDATYIYYEAESPGLSVFAITGVKKLVKVACPYECCVGEANYIDKACLSDYECKNHACVAKPPECLVCPSPTAWTECVNNKQTRTNYKCGADTNYICESYTEEQACEVKPPTIPKIPTRWVIAGAIIVVALIALAVLVWKKTIKLPF